MNENKLSHDQIRYAILSILYKKAEANSNGWEVSKEEITKFLDIPDNKIDFNIRYLSKANLIKLEDTMDTWVWAEITSEGINVIEHKNESKGRFSFLTAIIPIQIQAKIGVINL